MPRVKEKTNQVEIRVDPDHILDSVTVEETLAIAGVMGLAAKIQEGGEESAVPLLGQVALHAELLRDMLCKFVWNGDGYMASDEAQPIVNKLTMRQLWDTINRVMGAMSDTTESDTEAGE